eukprot:TRINITY_DN5131_c0_g1_i10.p1 TRINITY_DN5131_c0_g1~~TRINITY_DN5131_c0_g1_i10.p1  ORF type:complete len:1411 (+),score=415.70 TRINITY_DN5131_c0_g1_i10:83-4315(+)
MDSVVSGLSGVVNVLKELRTTYDTLAREVVGAEEVVTALSEALRQREKMTELKEDGIYVTLKGLVAKLEKQLTDCKEKQVAGKVSKAKLFIGSLCGLGARSLLDGLAETNAKLRQQVKWLTLSMMQSQTEGVLITASATKDIQHAVSGYVDEFVQSKDAQTFWKNQFQQQSKTGWDSFWAAFMSECRVEFEQEYGERAKDVSVAIRSLIDPDRHGRVRVQEFGKLFGRSHPKVNERGSSGKALLDDVLRETRDKDTGMMGSTHHLSGVLTCSHCVSISAMAENGMYLATADTKGFCKLWTVQRDAVGLSHSFAASNTKITALLIHRPVVHGVPGLKVVCGDDSSVVRSWDLYSADAPVQFKTQDASPPSAFCVGKEPYKDVLFAAMCSDGACHIAMWDMTTGGTLGIIPGPAEYITSIGVFLQYVVISSHDYHVYVWDFTKGLRTGRVMMSNGVQVVSIEPSEDEEHASILALTWDGNVFKYVLNADGELRADHTKHYDCTGDATALHRTSFAGHGYLTSVDFSKKEIWAVPTSGLDFGKDNAGGRVDDCDPLLPEPVSVMMSATHFPTYASVVKIEGAAYHTLGFEDGTVVLYPFEELGMAGVPEAKANAAWMQCRQVLSGRSLWLGLKDKRHVRPEKREVKVQRVVLDNGDGEPPQTFVAFAGANTVIKVWDNDRRIVNEVDLEELHAREFKNSAGKTCRRLYADDQITAFTVDNRAFPIVDGSESSDGAPAPDTASPPTSRVVTALRNGYVTLWDVDNEFWTGKATPPEDAWRFVATTFLFAGQENCEECGAAKGEGYAIQPICRACSAKRAHPQCLDCGQLKSLNNERRETPAAEEAEEQQTRPAVRPNQTAPARQQSPETDDYPVCDICYRNRKENHGRYAVNLELVDNLLVLFCKDTATEAGAGHVERRVAATLKRTGSLTSRWYFERAFPAVVARCQTEQDGTLLFFASGKYSIGCTRVQGEGEVAASMLLHCTMDNTILALAVSPKEIGGRSARLYVSMRRAFLTLYEIKWQDKLEMMTMSAPLCALDIHQKLARSISILDGKKESLLAVGDVRGVLRIIKRDGTALMHLWSLSSNRQAINSAFRWGEFLCTVGNDRMVSSQPWVTVAEGLAVMTRRLSRKQSSFNISLISAISHLVEWQMKVDGVGTWWRLPTEQSLVLTQALQRYRKGQLAREESEFHPLQRAVARAMARGSASRGGEVMISTEHGETVINFDTYTARRDYGDQSLRVRCLYPLRGSAKVPKSGGGLIVEDREVGLGGAHASCTLLFTAKKRDWGSVAAQVAGKDVTLYFYILSASAPHLKLSVAVGGGASHTYDVALTTTHHASVVLPAGPFFDNAELAPGVTGDVDVTLEMTVPGPGDLLVIDAHRGFTLYFDYASRADAPGSPGDLPRPLPAQQEDP